LLYNIVLQDTTDDTWYWKHDQGLGYIVKGGYLMLTHDDQHDQDPFLDIILNKAVSLTISLFMWETSE
jgi:hypothetical protein